MDKLSYNEQIIVISKVIQKKLQTQRNYYNYILDVYKSSYEIDTRELHDRVVKHYNIVKSFYEKTKDKIYDLKLANVFGKGFDTIDEIIASMNTTGGILDMSQIDTILSFSESFLLLFI